MPNNEQKKLEDDLHEVGQKIKHHEDNVKFLLSQKIKLDSSIIDMQVAIQEHHRTGSSKEVNDVLANVDNKEEIIQNILKYKNSAAALLCNLPSEAQVSGHFLIKDVIGVVATLGKVNDANLSRLLSEYLGLETMLAVVCKTYEGVKSLESYNTDGSINEGLGIRAFASSVGSPLDSPFNVICIEDLMPYGGELVADDPQRRFNLREPRLKNGQTPPGFLGFAVNMILLDNDNLYSVSSFGHNLRETLFYNLFSNLQVYKSREDMLKATPFITTGAISLDGGLIRSPGVVCLGHHRGDIDVTFPSISKELNLPLNYFKIKTCLMGAEWKNQRVLEDLVREKRLLDNARLRFETKKFELLQFLTQRSSSLTQGYRTSTSFTKPA